MNRNRRAVLWIAHLSGAVIVLAAAAAFFGTADVRQWPVNWWAVLVWVFGSFLIGLLRGWVMRGLRFEKSPPPLAKQLHGREKVVSWPVLLVMRLILRFGK